MLLSFFQLAVAIRNVWPGRMSLKAFAALYILLLAAGMPVTLLSLIPYGLYLWTDYLPGYRAGECLYGDGWIRACHCDR